MLTFEGRDSIKTCPHLLHLKGARNELLLVFSLYGLPNLSAREATVNVIFPLRRIVIRNEFLQYGRDLSAI